MNTFEVYTSLFVSSFLSSTLLPGHSELTLTAFIFLKKYSIIDLIFFASIGNILGSILNWCIGYYLTNLKDKKWFPINRLHLTRASSWFLKYGKWTLFLSWVPIIGDPLTVIAGVFRVQIHIFILIVSLAKTMRYIFISLVATNVL